MSYAEYLAAEEASDIKHEYLRGHVHPMAGGTPEHAALAMAVGIQLGTALRGKPCRVFSSDLRVRADETDLSTYPGLTVVCGHLQRYLVRHSDRNHCTCACVQCAFYLLHDNQF